MAASRPTMLNTISRPSSIRVAYNSAADEASILAETGVRLVPVRRANMRPHAWFMDDIELRAYRHTIETVNSQPEKMGIERLYARTNAGFELKVP